MPAERRRWWRRLTTVRSRTTVAATVAVGLALALAAVALVAHLQRSLVANVDDVAEARAADIAAQVGQVSMPALIAVPEEGSVVQVVDDSRRIVAASTNAPRDPFGSPRPSGDEPVTRTVRDLPGSAGQRFRLAALAASTPEGPVTIYVATSLEPVEETMALVRRTVALGAPALLALVAVTAWFVIGRALRPVDAIRAEVADITGRSLDRRVPVPAADDEISRLATTMNDMLDRLESAADRQRRFVADASHELRTPLAAARTDLEVALAHPSSADWTATATELLAENLRMEHLVTDLLYLAKADSSGQRAPLAPVDLDDLVLREAARLRAGTAVRIDTSRVSAAAVAGRRDELARVVRNLLHNAVRHASSIVTITLRAADTQSTLVVEDDGPGVPPADRERIFERFARLDDARSVDDGGTGLGLAIAREIVEAHGGTVGVQDGSAGARFVVTLPAM